MKLKLLLSALLLAAGPMPAAGKVRLPAVLDDHMVLQQQTQAKLWGWAAPGHPVTVKTSWDEKTYRTKAASDSTWMVRVATPAGGYTPYRVTVSDGDPTVISDVLVGEVWIFCGQSNVEMPLAGNPGQPVDHSLREILSAPRLRDRVRYATLQRQASNTPLTDGECRWTLLTSESAAKCSALGYYTAKQLNETLDVPVGILHNSWSASNIEAWMTPGILSRVEGADLGRASDSVRAVNQRLGMLYNGMLWPLKNYTARGFFWYQGESNLENSAQYPRMMEEMVAEWRRIWDAPGMPFYYVQIAPYIYSGADNMEAALVREAQMEALGRIPRSGMVPTIDAGSRLCIHPAQKDVTGFRLAALALADTYGAEGFPASGPAFGGVEFADGRAMVRFEGAPLGLVSVQPDIPGFEIAGDDRKFYPAHARIEGRKKPVVIVHSDSVPEPVAVRYAFRNYVEGLTLCNTFGIPAFPFRSDRWQIGQ